MFGRGRSPVLSLRRRPEGELPQENTKNTKEEFFFVLSAFFCGDFMSVFFWRVAWRSGAMGAEGARVEAEKWGQKYPEKEGLETAQRVFSFHVSAPIFLPNVFIWVSRPYC